MPQATLDEIQRELDIVAAAASEDVAAELQSLKEGLAELPADTEQKETRLRKTEDRLSELEHNVSGQIAGDLHTIQQNLQLVADDIDH